ncbi:IS4 family transposase [Prevotella nigrescens]|uniref:IS4 family transposase n=1 Tax=Prevotella nigrescens TaxID=28133 RepID=UPI001BAE1325|nr:IS4 family transposase [Prevotella nigrescens]QUB50846.1 IS4 family transposase [Prevotella nigrescens]
MNIGKYIFSQVIDFVPRYQFDKLVTKNKGDRHSRELNSYNHLLHLLFGQITGCDSLRDICMCLTAHHNILYHLGIRKTGTHSSLSRANENRNYHIYEELGKYLIEQVRPLYSETKLSEVSVYNVLYALDSTTISTSIVLATWALGKYSKGAVKMHTLLDLRGSIPSSIHITDGKWHDSNELDRIEPDPLAFYMMDKAYVDFDALYRFHKAGAFWICRPKDNMRYEIVDHKEDFDVSTGVRGDFTIRLTTCKSRKLYPEHIRKVCYYDAVNGKEVEFITNNFEIEALEIANLYRHRWDIEVFFKWIKQNIVVKTLWGFSKNAVSTHLWVAIITYLLIAKIKHEYKSPYSITEVATLIRISVLEKVNLKELITKQDPLPSHNQYVKERSLFDDI